VKTIIRKIYVVLLSVIFAIPDVGLPCDKIVLTGGPGVGKSSVLERLKVLARTDKFRVIAPFEVRPEAFTQLYEEAKVRNSLDELFSDPTGAHLRSKLVQRQAEFESCATEGSSLVLDRGMVDILTFGEILGHSVRPKDKATAELSDYGLVFFLEPLPQEYYQNTEIRRETYEESVETHKRLVADYQRYMTDKGKDPRSSIFYVPTFHSGALKMNGDEIENSVAKRAQFIFDKIKENCGLQ